ncbi:hypothetical protein AB9T88_02060, partial [Flavobacterium sp. LBUM151]
MKKFVLFIYCAFPSLFYPQVQKYDPKVNFAIETYAFLKGQSSALQKIAFQFPELWPNIAAAEKNSKVLFGRAQRNIERFLQNELDNLEYVKLQYRIDSLLTEQLKNPIEKEKYALDFLAKVRERPHFIRDTLLLKGIISFAYYDAPHQEITDGHSEIFTTKGHPKAEQSILKFPVPKSWLAEEAEMPETVQQFTSCSGKGNEKVLILIYDLPPVYNDVALSQNSISEMISPEAKLIRTDTVTIDGRPGIMIEVEENIQSAAAKMKVRMLQFMFREKRKLYCLQGSIG